MHIFEGSQKDKGFMHVIRLKNLCNHLIEEKNKDLWDGTFEKITQCLFFFYK